MEPTYTPCPVCARHRAAGEAVCSFCSASLAAGSGLPATPDQAAGVPERLTAPLYGAPPRAAVAPEARGPIARLLAWLRGR